MPEVNVIDSIVITEDSNMSNIYAQWSVFDPGITVYSDLTSARAVKLFLNWSDQNGTVLHTGDYFTFVVPDIFRQEGIGDVTDAEIKTPTDEVVATYSIYDNGGLKEVKITFTDYVETHSDISGDFWLLLFVGTVESTEQKTIEFVVNGDLAASGEVTVKPAPSSDKTPGKDKTGHSALDDIYDGYYIFNWVVYFNMDEDDVNGFRTVEDFSFEDIIPADSPHIFLTDEIRQNLGLTPDQFPLKVGEYTQADSYLPGDRYPFFEYQYNGIDNNRWFLDYAPLVNGYTTVGIDGGDGLNVSELVITEKSLSANLGRLTRPTGIEYCTIATVKIAESALGDTEVVKLFTNTFEASSGEEITKPLILYRFESGGSAQGITGDCSFTFTKVDENDAARPGAEFSLFTSESFESGSDMADRFIYSGNDGAVTFENLPEGTYYLLETVTPYDYIPNNTVYKVVLTETDCEIYYGDDFENKLSDCDNKIINKSKFVSVTLEGKKNLAGQTMSSGMFGFVVKNSSGTIVATGTNDVNGNITFSEIKFFAQGEYDFTVEEVTGGYSRIIYDASDFPVTVKVTDDGNGKLTAKTVYPDKDIVFNNRSTYADEPVWVTLEGTKNLTGITLEDGMFSFVVKNSSGDTVAAGTNAADGSITFGEIEFDEPGVYVFTVEEIKGSLSGITYDDTIFTVTVTIEEDGNGNLTIQTTYEDDDIVFNNSYTVPPVKPCQCYGKTTKCRTSIEGRKIWVDNDNADDTRPAFAEITLLRDGEVYKSLDVDSTGDGAFVFCCVPIWKNSSHKYNYQIDEMKVPDRYTKTIEGYNVINTLIP